MAKVNQVTLCPGCGEEIPYPTPEQCTTCGFVLLMPAGSLFVRPEYLSLQAMKLVDTLEGKRMPDAERAKQLVTTERQRRLWCRTCPDQDRVAAVLDAHYILQELLHARASIETAKKVVKMGKRLGALATTIDDYVAHGGRFYGLPNTPRPEAGESDLDSLK